MRFIPLLFLGAALSTVSAVVLPPQDSSEVVSTSERSSEIQISNSMSAIALPTVDHTDTSVSSIKAERKAAKKGSLKPLDFTKSDPESIARGRAEASTLSKTSHVEGKHFTRYALIFLENTDFESAAANGEYIFCIFQNFIADFYRRLPMARQPRYYVDKLQGHCTSKSA